MNRVVVPKNNYITEEDPKTHVSRIEYFNEHWYQIPDVKEKVPSVSHVIESILAKGYGYDEWLKSVGHEANYIVRETQDSGSRLHKAFRELVSGETIRAVTDSDSFTRVGWLKVMNFVNWYKELGDINTLSTELMVYDTQWSLGGTADWVVTIDGVNWLLDYKTGNDIYDSSELQIVAYMQMLNKMNDLGIIKFKVEKCGIVHIGARNRTKRGMSNKGVGVTVVDYENTLKQFESILQLYKWRFPNEKAPSDTFPLEISLVK